MITSNGWVAKTWNTASRSRISVSRCWKRLVLRRSRSRFHVVSPSGPKKSRRMLLSMPTTSQRASEDVIGRIISLEHDPERELHHARIAGQPRDRSACAVADVRVGQPELHRVEHVEDLPSNFDRALGADREAPMDGRVDVDEDEFLSREFLQRPRASIRRALCGQSRERISIHGLQKSQVF